MRLLERYKTETGKDITVDNYIKWLEDLEIKRVRSMTLFDECVEKETTFIKSKICDLEKWQNALSKEMKAGINVEYYFNAVMDWAEQLPQKDKRRKKTSRGWLAVGRNFMRTDKNNDKLQIIQQEKDLFNSSMIKHLESYQV